MKTLLICLAFLTSLTAISHAVISLGDGQGFNAVIFGDHTATTADTEGRLAVGGNSSLPGSYSVGESVIGPQNSQSNGARNDLVVQGNLSVNGIVTVNFGNAQVGGAILGSGSLSQGSGNQSFSNVSNFQNDIFNFTEVESLVRGYSSTWAGLSTTGTILDEGFALTLTGTDAVLNVFNITGDQWNVLGDRYIDVPVGSTVIINISGTAVSNGGGAIKFGPDFDGAVSPDPFRNNVIYNLNEALTVQSDFLLWEGSVFAPDATLTTNGGAINGQAFFESVNQEGNFEFHNFGVDASNAPVPEPSTYALILGAFALAVSISRRR